MNNDTTNMVKRLSFENWIWVTFIIISVLDIYGDELLKKNLTKQDKEAQKKAHKIFLIVSIISIFIYIYFLARNSNDYEKYHNKSYEVRLVGSILILIGSLCLLYFQITTMQEIDSPSNV